MKLQQKSPDTCVYRSKCGDYKVQGDCPCNRITHSKPNSMILSDMRSEQRPA